MTLIPIETLPVRKNRHRNQITKLLKEFSESDYKIARVDFDNYEYGSSYKLYTSLHHTIRISKCPVKLRMVNSEVYLLKT